jgi:hypothetical protein
LLAVFVQDSWLYLKVVELLFRVNIALKTLDWRNPSWLSDECGDMANLLADGWKDLDAGGANLVSIFPSSGEYSTYKLPISPTCLLSSETVSSQAAVCRSVPLYLSRHGIAGHLQLFKMPLALMRISQ